jgi:hypothetical protein
VARAAWVAAVAAVVTGCASAVPVDPAPDATDARCAEVLVVVRDLDQLAGRERRPTTSQSTAAWGNPPVVLRCGVEPPGPTTDACVAVDGVDWVLTPGEESTTWTTYGREPAVEVVLPGDVAGSDAVLAGLTPAVTGIEPDRACL